MRRSLLTLCALSVVALFLSSCAVAVEPGYPNWCYYHPYRCHGG